MPRTRLILPPEYIDLVIENRSLEKELALMNRYAASIAQRLVDSECRAGKPDGQPDAPSLRTRRGTRP